VPVYYAHNLTHQPETREGFISRYWDQPSNPLYRFGYGLGYSNFGVSNLRLLESTVKLGGAVEVSVDVENTGARAGSEVVQLYIHQIAGRASRPVRELKGFEKVWLGPGEKKTVRFSLGKSQRSYWSAQARGWVEEAESFDLWAGTDSAAALHANFKIVP
jgi:beta-glucosidase